MISISIRDFQSIQEAYLEFHPGITVITGSTNSGKTAIFRAVDFLLNNPGYAKYSIKTGEKKSEITLSIEGCPSVKWVRSPSKVSYIIGNGKPNENCGRANIWSFEPQFPIQPEPDGQILNFHGEFDALFPFGFSYQELFKVFERVMALDDTASVLKAMNDDSGRVTMLRRHLKASIENRNQAAVEEEKTLRQLEGVLRSESEIQLEGVSVSEERELLGHSLLEMNELLNRVHQQAIQFEELNRILDSIYPSLILFQNFFIDLRKSRDTENLLGLEKDNSFDKEKEVSTTIVSELRDSSSKTDGLFRIAVGLYKDSVSIQECLKKMEVLSKVPEIQTVSLESLELAKRLLKISDQYSTLEKIFRAVEGLPEAPKAMFKELLDRASSLLEISTKLRVVFEKKKCLESDLSEYSKYLQFLNDEISKYNVCELCGAPIKDGVYCCDKG